VIQKLEEKKSAMIALLDFLNETQPLTDNEHILAISIEIVLAEYRVAMWKKNNRIAA
jgi:hypothetical protein